MHLERGCLALAAWQSIADSSCFELSTSVVLRAQCVAAGFGVRLDDDGSVSSAASAGVSERVIEAVGRFGSRFARDQDRFTASMVANFQSDLGRGFEFESLSPSPNFRLTRCLYREIAVAGGAPGAQGFPHTAYSISNVEAAANSSETPNFVQTLPRSSGLSTERLSAASRPSLSNGTRRKANVCSVLTPTADRACHLQIALRRA